MFDSSPRMEKSSSQEAIRGKDVRVSGVWRNDDVREGGLERWGGVRERERGRGCLTEGVCREWVWDGP